jgi:pimeloyl-ACP methyl ester carboxylesterase
MTIDVVSNSPLRVPPADYAARDAAQWFTIPSGHDAGKTMFYLDQVVGSGSPRATVLFVHGNPESSYTYRHVRSELAASGVPLRLIAADNIGFGLSDQASFEMVDMHHAANLAQLVEALGLNRVTLVIHDWGGPIGVGAFLDRLDRIERLVVMNTTIFPMPLDGLTYENFPLRMAPWSKMPQLTPDRMWGGMAAAVVTSPVGASMPGMVMRSYAMQARYVLRRIPAGTPEGVFSEALRSRANTRSSKRNVLQTPVWGHGYRYADRTLGEQDNSEFYRRMQADVPRAWSELPAIGHFGARDPLGKKSVIAQWVEALPTMQVHRHTDTGHFVAEAKGPEIAQSILAPIS